MTTSKKKTIQGMIWGDEPSFDNKEYSQSEFIQFLNWYNYNTNHEELKKYTLDYVAEYMPNLILAHNIDEIPKTLFKATLGALCRIIMRGYPKSDYIDNKIHTQLYELFEYAGEREAKKPVTAISKPVVKKNNVDSYIDDVEAYIDNCISTGNFYKKDWKKFIAEYKIKKNEGKVIADYFTYLLNELKESNEGYDNISKADFNKYKDIVDNVVNTFSNIVGTSKTRIKKPVDKFKLVSKVKYMENFDELGLESIHPVHIIDAKYVVLYNTKYKKIQLIVAEDKLTIRGSTIYGINKETSQSKTVRKPELIKHKFVKKDFPYILGSFRELKTKDSAPTGAINDNTLILVVI